MLHHLKALWPVFVFPPLILVAMFVFASTTGIKPGDWTPGSAEIIDFSNMTPKQNAITDAIGTLACILPFAGALAFWLLIQIVRVTASLQTRKDAHTALMMGEHGVGTWLWGNVKPEDFKDMSHVQMGKVLIALRNDGWRKKDLRTLSNDAYWQYLVNLCDGK